MLYGISPVVQALLHGNRPLHRVLLREGLDSPRIRAVLAQARAAEVEVQRVPAHELSRRVGHRRHQGVALECGDLPVLDLPALLARDAGSRALVLALDQVEDPQNLGGLIRTAAFLGASAVLVPRAHSSPLSPAVSKASAGALESFPVVVVPNLAQALSELRDRGYATVGAALDPGSIVYQEFDWSIPLVLVMGNEGAGLRSLTRRRCDALVWVDGEPDTESLNVTVAAGILLARVRLVRGGNTRP